MIMNLIWIGIGAAVVLLLLMCVGGMLGKSSDEYEPYEHGVGEVALLAMLAMFALVFFLGCGQGEETRISLNAEQNDGVVEPEDALTGSQEACCTIEPPAGGGPGCVYSLLPCGINQSGETDTRSELPFQCQPPYRTNFPEACKGGE
jgi:hypothetical protein